MTEAAIIALAKAFEAACNAYIEHERGMSQAQREERAGWENDDIRALREFTMAFTDQIKALLPKATP